MNHYLMPTELFQEARRRLEELRGREKLIARRQERYPQGSIHVANRKAGIQYYLRTDAKDKTGTYISKKEEKLIRALLQKKYDQEVLKQLELEVKCLEKLLGKADQSAMKIRHAYAKYPQEVRQYIQPIDVEDEDYAREWQGVPYEGKTFYEDGPVRKTDRGERVRSKSELTIANMLNSRGIPYRYEAPLKLRSGRIIYPDFTILNIRTRKEIYWEHRGMMDDRNYANHTVERLKEFIENEIFLGDNLIITEETTSASLGTVEIEKLIAHYFL